MVSLSPIETELIAKLVLSAVLGGLVGFEREVHKKPAGMRTHALVCMGSALFTVISLSFSGANVDVSRIAAGVVTGIGFLSAGVIFRAEDKVKGLTTAAELWVLAAIGVAVGIGLYVGAIATTLIMWIILVPFKSIEVKAEKKFQKSKKLPED